MPSFESMPGPDLPYIEVGHYAGVAAVEKILRVEEQGADEVAIAGMEEEGAEAVAALNEQILRG